MSVTEHPFAIQAIAGDVRRAQMGLSWYFNPRPAGGPGFPRPAGEVFEHPLLTRLLGHVAIRGRRRSKERQK